MIDYKDFNRTIDLKNANFSKESIINIETILYSTGDIRFWRLWYWVNV